MTTDGVLRSYRLLAVLVLLVAFNAAAISLIIAGGFPASTGTFAAWFVGDIVVGLVVLGLTDRG